MPKMILYFGEDDHRQSRIWTIWGSLRAYLFAEIITTENSYTMLAAVLLALKFSVWFAKQTDVEA